MSLLNYDSKIRFRTEFNIHNVFIQTPCQKPRDAKSKHRQKCLRYWNNVARSHFPFSLLVLKLAQALSKQIYVIKPSLRNSELPCKPYNVIPPPSQKCPKRILQMTSCYLNMCHYPKFNAPPTQLASEQITAVLKRCNSIILLMRMQRPRDWDARTLFTAGARAQTERILENILMSRLVTTCKIIMAKSFLKKLTYYI